MLGELISDYAVISDIFYTNYDPKMQKFNIVFPLEIFEIDIITFEVFRVICVSV